MIMSRMCVYREALSIASARRPQERPVGPIAKVHSMLVAWIASRALRRAEDDLRRLDARTLKDMGLDRSEIGSVLLDRARERKNGVIPPATAFF